VLEALFNEKGFKALSEQFADQMDGAGPRISAVSANGGRVEFSIVRPRGRFVVVVRVGLAVLHGERIHLAAEFDIGH